jgi:paraquat-inducible protein B
VIAFDLDADGKGVTLRVFVNGPYDKFVTNNTRFWNASGIDISLDANGLRFDSESLASILAGGIAFEDPPDSTSVTEAEAGTKFALVATRQVAMKLPDREVQTFLAYFGDELRGLSPGAPVDFGGVVVGEVKSITIEYDPQAKLLRFPVQIDIYPDRLRARFREGTRTAEEIAKEGRVLDDLIERGYRLQLRTGNLLTGQLYVAFARFSEAPKAALDRSKTPPVLPTTPSGLRALQETVAKLGNKLDDLPLEEIAADARQTLQTLTRTLESTDALVKRVNADVTPEVQAMLQDARQTLASADHQLSARSPALVQVQQAMAELERAAQALRVLAETLQRQPESLIHGKKGDAP